MGEKCHLGYHNFTPSGFYGRRIILTLRGFGILLGEDNITYLNISLYVLDTRYLFPIVHEAATIERISPEPVFLGRGL